MRTSRIKIGFLQVKRVFLNKREAIGPFGQRSFQHRRKVAVALNRNHMTATLQQSLGERSDARANLQNEIVRHQTRKIGDLLNDIVINQEVLTKRMLCGQPMRLKDLTRGTHSGKR